MSSAERFANTNFPFSFRFGSFFRGRPKNERHPVEGELNPENIEAPRVERMRLVQSNDYERILRWASHPEVSKHLDPLPNLPQDWSDRDQVESAIASLAEYYNDLNRTTPFASVDQRGELVAVGTMRWQGDPYAPQERTASIERVIVDPDRHGLGIGTTHIATMIEFGFYIYRGYGARGAREIRAWVMSDEQARPWDRNFQFFRQFGMRVVPSAPHWKEFAQAKGIPTERDATWFRLQPEWYEQSKQENPRVRPCGTLDISVFGRPT